MTQRLAAVIDSSGILAWIDNLDGVATRVDPKDGRKRKSILIALDGYSADGTPLTIKQFGVSTASKTIRSATRRRNYFLIYDVKTQTYCKQQYLQ